MHSRCKYVLHAYFWKASPTQHVTNIMRDKLSSFTHKWKTRCSKKAKSLVLSSTFFVQKHSCLVFIFTTSSSRLDTSVEATNKGIWALAEIEPYNLICCWDLLSTLGKSTFFQDIQKLALKKDFAAVCFLFLFFVYVFHLFTFLIVCLRFLAICLRFSAVCLHFPTVCLQYSTICYLLNNLFTHHFYCWFAFF